VPLDIASNAEVKAIFAAHATKKAGGTAAAPPKPAATTPAKPAPTVEPDDSFSDPGMFWLSSRLCMLIAG
jgi:hypothetical protein